MCDGRRRLLLVSDRAAGRGDHSSPVAAATFAVEEDLHRGCSPFPPSTCQSGKAKHDPLGSGSHHDRIGLGFGGARQAAGARLARGRAGRAGGPDRASHAHDARRRRRPRRVGAYHERPPASRPQPGLGTRHRAGGRRCGGRSRLVARAELQLRGARRYQHQDAADSGQARTARRVPCAAPSRRASCSRRTTAPMCGARAADSSPCDRCRPPSSWWRTMRSRIERDGTPRSHRRCRCEPRSHVIGCSGSGRWRPRERGTSGQGLPNNARTLRRSQTCTVTRPKAFEHPRALPNVLHAKHCAPATRW